MWLSFLALSHTAAFLSPVRVHRETICCKSTRPNRSPTIRAMTTTKDTLDDGPPQKHIVLIGGGHAHVQVIKALHEKARGEHIKVTLIDALQSACYSGMVPGCAVGSYRPEEALIDLEKLAEWSSITFVNDAVVDVDFESKQVFIAQTCEPIPFDVVSIDIGSVSRDLEVIPGAIEHSIPTRPIHKLVGRLDQAMRLHGEHQEHLDDGGDSVPPHIIVVGGGIAGIELALSVTTRWQESFPAASCTLLNAGSELIPNESQSARRKLEEILQDKRIRVRHNAMVQEVKKDCVVLEETNDIIRHSICVWATGAGANPLAKKLTMERGLDATEHG